MTAIEAPRDTSQPSAATSPWPLGEVLRDISRGGIAGLIVGLVVAGLGGRVAMRLAALAVPSATGSFTENGNRIGDITLGGSLGLIIFVGLLASLFLATIWVTISPWLPGPTIVKGLLAAPIAVAFGSVALIDSNNPDFVVLRHDPLVVAILLTTVALTGPAMALTDDWLDRRLPAAGASTSRVGTTYALLSTIGAMFGSDPDVAGGGEPGIAATRPDDHRGRGHHDRVVASPCPGSPRAATRDGGRREGHPGGRHGRRFRGPLAADPLRAPARLASGRERPAAFQLAMTTRVDSARRCA